MKQKQNGFTLLELMLVIAIIGILASIAIPAYQDYTVRSKITEGLQLSSSAKLAVSETYQSTGSFPNDNAAAGLPAASSIVGNYVKSVSVQNGAITIEFQNINSTVNASSLVLTPSSANAGAIGWTCQSPGAGIPNKWLPAQCRS